LLPQLLLLPQERILLSGAVVGGDPALVLRPVRPRGLPGQRAVPLAAVELFVRGRGLASVRLGRAAELLLGGRGLPLRQRARVHGAWRAAAVLRPRGRVIRADGLATPSAE